ncbi:MAG: hypothetical protein ACI9EK_002980, partial [Psychroserpens sp.]
SFLLQAVIKNTSPKIIKVILIFFNLYFVRPDFSVKV